MYAVLKSNIKAENIKIWGQDFIYIHHLKLIVYMKNFFVKFDN